MQGKATRHHRIAVAQVGGPTAVLNASLLGFLKTAAAHPDSPEVYGIAEGMAGLVAGRLYPIELGQPLDWLRGQPGAALGAGRMVMTEEDIVASVGELQRRGIHHLALAGGNGTMWACMKLSEAARARGFELHVVGIPKTVDNDIEETDHTPGFPSAAKFVAHAIRDLSADLASMRNFEQVRVVETMGRNVGWLTAAAAFFREREEDAPHLIYIPEAPFRMEEAVAAVSRVQRELGYCLVVVGEGLKDEGGRPLAAHGINNSRHNGQGMKALGGIGALVAETISNELGLACRYENLGILQRCASLCVSFQDLLEAEAVGVKAAELLLSGVSGVMVTIERLPGADGGYRWATGTAPLERVAGLERSMAPGYWEASSGTITDAYREWLRPLIGMAAPYGRIWKEQTAGRCCGT
jgi:6-phosphofructokinase